MATDCFLHPITFLDGLLQHAFDAGHFRSRHMASATKEVQGILTTCNGLVQPDELVKHSGLRLASFLKDIREDADGHVTTNQVRQLSVYKAAYIDALGILFRLRKRRFSHCCQMLSAALACRRSFAADVVDDHLPN